MLFDILSKYILSLRSRGHLSSVVLVCAEPGMAPVALGGLESAGELSLQPPLRWLSSRSRLREPGGLGFRPVKLLSVFLCVSYILIKEDISSVYILNQKLNRTGTILLFEKESNFFSSHQIGLSSYIPLSLKSVLDHKGYLILMENFCIWSLFLDTVK